MPDRDVPSPEAARVEVTTSRQFTSWLAETGLSLAISTYQSGKLILLDVSPATGRLAIFERTLERPMAVAVAGDRMAVAGLYQIIPFVDAMQPGAPLADGGWDSYYVPQMASFTGDLDTHDMAFDASGRLVFVNTLFSCLATVSETHRQSAPKKDPLSACKGDPLFGLDRHALWAAPEP